MKEKTGNVTKTYNKHKFQLDRRYAAYRSIF